MMARRGGISEEAEMRGTCDGRERGQAEPYCTSKTGCKLKLRSTTHVELGKILAVSDTPVDPLLTNKI